MSSRRKSFTMRLAIAFGFFGYAAAARSKYSHISGSWHMTDFAEYGQAEIRHVPALAVKRNLGKLGAH